MRPATALLLAVLMLGGCSSQRPEPGVQSVVGRMENALADHLLAEARTSLKAAGPGERDAVAGEARDTILRSVDRQRLTPEMRHRVDRFLSRGVDGLPDSNSERSAMVLAGQIPADQLPATFELAMKEVERFEPQSEPTNDLPGVPTNDPAGRQEYLDLVYASVLSPTVIGAEPEALTIIGLEESANRLFDYINGTFRIDLSDMSRLPFAEAPYITRFFTAPGLHIAGGFDVQEQARVAWAAYVSCLGCAPGREFDLRELTVLRDIAALAATDAALRSGAWQPEEAANYLVENTSYPIDRVQWHVAAKEPDDLWMLMTSGRRAIEDLVAQFDHVQAHATVLAAGPRSLADLKQLLMRCAPLPDATPPHSDEYQGPVECPRIPPRSEKSE